MSCGCNSIGDSKNEVVATDIDGPSARFKRLMYSPLFAEILQTFSESNNDAN